MEIKDLEKPVKLSVTIESGKLLHAFLLQTIQLKCNVDEQFNTWIKNFLNIVTEEKTTADLFADYFMANCDKNITKMQLRALNFVNGNKFSRYFHSIYGEIVEILNENGYSLIEVSRTGTARTYKCTRGV